MSHLVVDLEKGAAALFHGLEGEGVTDVSGLPPEATAAVGRLAVGLGIPDTELTKDAAGWLFDLLMHATAAIGVDTGHAAAGGTEVAAPPANQAPGDSVAESKPETAPVSEDVAKEVEQADANIPPLNPTAPEHGPADTDLPPVTNPRAGYEICPKCSGFRTVLDNGAVVPCPECLGAGEIPIAAGAGA